MIGILALPALALVSAVSLHKALRERWAVALIVAAVMAAFVALLQFVVPLHLTISERITLWCLPVLAATDAASRVVSRAALLVALCFSLWGHVVQLNYHVAALTATVALAVSLPMMFGLRKIYGKDVIGDGDIAFAAWLAIALGIVSPVAVGVGALMAGRRREVPLVAYAAIGACLIIVFLAEWGRFPWRS